MTPALETHNLAVGYRRRGQTRVVLGSINVSVAPGEVICLLGLNGAGKTTLMRTLAGSQKPLDGAIEINGIDTSRMSQFDLARHMAVVLTERIAVGALRGFRLVELGRYPHLGWAGILSDKDHATVEMAIEAAGAQHLAERDVDELSDGERQRLMIARALAQEPAVLVLDEPAAYLDVSGRVELVAMLRRLARERGVAVILSSHDLELSLRTSDTIWLIDRDGRLQIGAPEDMLSDGWIEAVFSSADVPFNARERSFRVASQTRGRAFVEGDGDGMALARSVMEREGFEIVATPDKADITISIHAAGWTARYGTGGGEGIRFAELARFARQASWPDENMVGAATEEDR